MIELIVNADDFGYSNGVNYGIIDAHRNGIVNSTTMLVNTPGVEHAALLAKQYPTLGVGVHLNLTFGKPVSENVSSLVNDTGQFSFKNNTDVSLEEVEREWEAQIEKFLSLGLKPTHFDSHHHVHRRPFLAPVVKSLAEKYKLPVRNVFVTNEEQIPLLTEIFIDKFYGRNLSADVFKMLPEKVPAHSTVEMMCHPAYIDTFLKSNSSYCEERLTELDILTSVALPEGIKLKRMI